MILFLHFLKVEKMIKIFSDQMNRTIRLGSTPKRIVSLVPSQTELLYDLGLGDSVIGITKFCIHPESWYHSKQRIGGTKNADFEKIKALKPDLIIGNKEENERSDIEALEKIAPVWMSDIFDLKDSLEMISMLGSLLDIENKADDLIRKINFEFKKLDSYVSVNTNLIKKNAAYFIWKNPNMVAGKNTFIDDMIERCGFVNHTYNERYPIFELKDNQKLDFIFLSSEPFPFKQKEVDEFQLNYPKSIVKIVDGEYFSWYGSRLLNAPNYFIKLLKELKN